jgi:G3E family GTPase
MNLFQSDWPGVVRSKGFFWLATRMEWVGEMSQAGGMLQAVENLAFGSDGTFYGPLDAPRIVGIEMEAKF